MNKLNLRIQHFKCFHDKTFELNNLTVFTGANAAGKSSAIQALLLARLATKNITINEYGNYQTTVNINDPVYGLELGSIDDIYNIDEDIYSKVESEGEICITVGNASFIVPGFEEAPEGHNVIFESVTLDDSEIKDNAFYYLSADRQGPHYTSQRFVVKGQGCGFDGKATAAMIFNNEVSSVPKGRWFSGKDVGNFKVQLDNWVEFIFPGITVRSIVEGKDSLRIVIRASWQSQEDAAPNIGYGISYALPILVDGLLIPENGFLLIENPEAHLHAKAQSNMGWFLGKIAASGVRVIVETHSEHIVNGIRKAVVMQDNLSSEMVNIYFLNHDEKGQLTNELIKIDDEGNLSDFPVDFFDQARQDLKEIFDFLRNRK